MPSVSRRQQHLFQAAEHGAKFALADKLRASMTAEQLHDFASGPLRGKPDRSPKNLGSYLRSRRGK